MKYGQIWMKKYAEQSKAKKKKTEQLKEGLKSSILGPQNLESGGAQAPRAPPDPLVQDCIPVGCVSPACCPYLPACTAQGGDACLWSGGPASAPGGGCLVLGGGGVCSRRGSAWSRGGCLPLVLGGVCIPACNGADPPSVNRITDACKNITLPQLRCGR